MRHAMLVSTLAVCAANVAEARPVNVGEPIALRSHHGRYLVAEDNGDLNANRGAVGGWETFTVQTAAGRSDPRLPVSRGATLSLRSDHGTYVVAEDDGRANANRGAVGDWERWVVLGPNGEASGAVECGAQIALRGAHGRYLVAESDGRANADRWGVGEWERFTVECLAPAVDGYTLSIAGGDGALLAFAAGQLTVGADGTLHLSGAVELRAGGLVSTMADADVYLTLDGAGQVQSLWGRARIVPAAQVGQLGFAGGLVGEVGLRFGHELGHLEAPLRGDTRYFYVDLDGAAALSAGPLGAQFTAGATVVYDPADPFVYGGAYLTGLTELTVFESAAVGVSAHGRIPLRATHDWGLESAAPSAEGHLYARGRFALSRLPLTIDGEVLLDADVNGDGRGLFDGEAEYGLLANGAGTVNIGFGPFTAFQMPLTAGSFGGTRLGEAGEVWFSGDLGADARDLLPQLPFEMSGRGRAAGRLSTDPARLAVQIGAEARIGGLALAQATLRIDGQGATLVGDMDLSTLSVQVRGAVDAHQAALSGTGRISLPVVGPRTITETIDVAVQYTANAAVCGYDTVVDGAVCGYHTVTDAAVCGTRTITDGAVCGYDTIVDWFCQTFGGCSRSARSCSVANSCQVESSCQVAASCTRIEPRQQQRLVDDFDWGTLRSDVTVGVDLGGVSAAGQLEYCAFDSDACAPLTNGRFEVNGAGIRACGDIAGLGAYCADL